MRNFRCWAVSRFAVGAAPCGRPAVDGSDIGHAPENPQYVGRGLAPAVGGHRGRSPLYRNWVAGGYR